MTKPYFGVKSGHSCNALFWSGERSKADVTRDRDCIFSTFPQGSRLPTPPEIEPESKASSAVLIKSVLARLLWSHGRLRVVGYRRFTLVGRIERSVNLFR